MKKIGTYLLACFILFYYHHSFAQHSNAMAGIDTSFSLNINGVDQYIEIKGASREKPVLLFIHGGPSWPATPMIRKYNEDLPKDFVLVCWDQRNCGKSKKDSAVIQTPALYVEDAHLLTQYLKKEFHSNKIFIACHSWGTVIGIYLISKYPEDYAAYIGMGQFVNPNKSEILARKYVTEQATLNKDTLTLNALQSISFTEETGYKNGFDDLIKFSMMANKYFLNKNVATLGDPTQLSNDYSQIDWMTPVMTTGRALFNYMNSVNIDFFPYKEFKIPIYFFLGRYDYNTSSVVAEQYFKTIKAPMKKLYWFGHSGHSPCWEEPALFYQRLVEVAAQCKIN